MMRLDMFLKHTGLIKQRSQAKRACDDGRVVLIGPSGEKTAKASQAVHVGERVRIETMTRRIEIEVLALPERTPARSERQRFYRLLSEEQIDPFADLSF